MHTTQDVRPGRARTRRAPHAVLVLAALAFALAACVPAAGRGTAEFVAPAEDVIGEIAAVAPNLQPVGQMSFYTVEAIGDRFVTISSQSTVAITVLFRGAVTTEITFTTAQRGPVTVVAASGSGTNANADIERIPSYLRTIFDQP